MLGPGQHTSEATKPSHETTFLHKMTVLALSWGDTMSIFFGGFRSEV